MAVPEDHGEVGMDLNRWGLQKFTRLSARYRNFQEFLGQVLEGERSLLENSGTRGGAEDAEEPFSVRDDIERLLQTPVPSRGQQSRRAESIFESLAPFFEAGFLVKGGPESGGRLLEMFMFGRVFVPPEPEGAAVHLPLPAMRPDQVFKGPVKPILRSFKLETIRTLHDASVFLFAPKPGVYFLVICDRPHPWQLGMIEKTQMVLSELFAKVTHQPARRGLFR